MKTRPATEYVLLGSLFQGPKHGYEIMNFLEESLGHNWYVGTSQLYTVLKRLEKMGLVRGSVKHQETRPSKRIFSLTPKGREIFEQWTKLPSDHVRDMRIEFLAKLYFIKNYRMQWGRSLVEKQGELLQQRQSSLTAQKKKERDPYLRLICTFKLHTIKAWLTWLKKEAQHFVEGP